jgi:large subunit ribosomal protein L19
MTAVQTVESKYLKKVPELRSGDVVRVHQKIREGNKERIQVFEGVVLRVKGGGLKATFLVRKISFGVGVEKNFLLHSPNIAKIEVKKRSKVRQAYIGYLRNLSGKSARLKDKQFDILAVNVKEEEPEVEEPTKEEAIDAAITEINAEEAEDALNDDVPLEKLEKEEEKVAASEDTADQTNPDMVDDEQQAETEEIQEGLDKAEDDLGSGKEREGETAEKNVENDTPKDIKEEIEQEKESEVG